ncbi:MAG: hypothetical protein OXF79_19190 [Chloroflexi bacterium]|nr:hypothetical protein [Chloroflexota bacterium]
MSGLDLVDAAELVRAPRLARRGGIVKALTLLVYGFVDYFIVPLVQAAQEIWQRAHDTADELPHDESPWRRR